MRECVHCHKILFSDFWLPENVAILPNGYFVCGACFYKAAGITLSAYCRLLEAMNYRVTAISYKDGVITIEHECVGNDYY